MKRTLMVLCFSAALCAPGLLNSTAVSAAPDGGSGGSGCKDKVTICHRTGSMSNPFVRITVSCNALDAHMRHGDMMPNMGMCGRSGGVD